MLKKYEQIYKVFKIERKKISKALSKFMINC